MTHSPESYSELSGKCFFVVLCNFLLETSVSQQCINLWLAAAEVAVHCHAVINTAGGEDVLAELLGNLLVEDVACLLECIECIGIKHLGPHIAVVAGAVAATHCVAEVCHAVAWQNL